MTKKKMSTETWKRWKRAAIFEWHKFKIHDGAQSWCKACEEDIEFVMDIFFDPSGRAAIARPSTDRISLREFIDKQCGGNTESAAATLGVNRLTIYRWLSVRGAVEVKKRTTRRRLKELNINMGLA